MAGGILRFGLVPRYLIVTVWSVGVFSSGLCAVSTRLPQRRCIVVTPGFCDPYRLHDNWFSNLRHYSQSDLLEDACHGQMDRVVHQELRDVEPFTAGAACHRRWQLRTSSIRSSAPRIAFSACSRHLAKCEHLIMCLNVNGVRCSVCL